MIQLQVLEIEQPYTRCLFSGQIVLSYFVSANSVTWLHDKGLSFCTLPKSTGEGN